MRTSTKDFARQLNVWRATGEAPDALQEFPCLTILEFSVAAIRFPGRRAHVLLLRKYRPILAQWRKALWNAQTDLGCAPYYAFVARDTGAQHDFALRQVRAWSQFRSRYQRVSGTCRTVRDPGLPTTPGKVEMRGTREVAGEERLFFEDVLGAFCEKTTITPTSERFQ